MTQPQVEHRADPGACNGGPLGWCGPRERLPDQVLVSDVERRLYHDPPHMFVRWEPDERHDDDGPGELEWGVALAGQPELVLDSDGFTSQPDGEDEARADAWAWHDLRLALAHRLRCLTGRSHWPENLAWPTTTCHAVDRWLRDSTAEQPEVLT